MSQLSYSFLGTFVVSRDNKNVLGFATDKIRALLAYLVVEADRPHHREYLAALVWPDQTDTAARQSLRQALYVVRQVLGGDREPETEGESPTLDPQSSIPVPALLITRQTVQFNRASDSWCDVWSLNSLLVACNTHDHTNLGNPDRCTECIERLHQATDLYRGEFLQGFAINDSREFEEWVLLERETHHRGMMRALGRLADYYEDIGEHERSLRFATWQLKLEPWHEESHRQAMRLLSRTGQRSAALAQYETCRRVLADEMGLEPARETTALYERIRDAETEPRAAHAPEERPVGVGGNFVLPNYPTPLIGREAEVTAVAELLLRDEVRVVTITGPGGVGKTRIAMQVTYDLAQEKQHFPDGAYFVNLAPITDPDFVSSEMASALGLTETPDKTMIESLVSYLQGKQVLLLLDNFEQVAEAAPLITRLVQGTTGTKVLVTSRATLGLRGTQEFPVPPMSLPPPAIVAHAPKGHRPTLPDTDVERVAGYEGIRLFVARAGAVKPGFEITSENAAAIVEICQRLDGLPLAIELAAARIKVLPPGAMLARLQGRLQLVAGKDRDVPARQQTLRNAIEWSYDLLDEGEQQLFRRMAVFQGGCTLEGTDAVCNFDGQLQLDVLDGVESLANKSLLQQREGSDGEPRFWMLETIHEYARENLGESGEAEALRSAHARYYMELAEKTESELAGVGEEEWLSRLEEEHDNLRAALQWAGEAGDSADAADEIGLRIAASLWRFWSSREHWSEGREQLVRVLDGAQRGSGQAPGLKLYVARALNGAGNLAWAQGDLDAARALHEESLVIRRELGDRRGIATSLNNLGLLADGQGEYAAARALYEESLAVWRDLRAQWEIASSLNNLGLVASHQGDYAAARAGYEEALAIWRELESPNGIGTSLNNLGLVADGQGEYATARALYEKALAIFRELGEKGNIAWSLMNLAYRAHHEQDFVRAQDLYRESLSLAREIGDKVWIAACLVGLARVAGQQGQGERGSRLLGTGEGLLEEMGAVMDRREQELYEEAGSQLRALLGGDEFKKARQEGRAMSMDQSVEYALKETYKGT